MNTKWLAGLMARLNPLLDSFQFIRRHWLFLLVLGTVAGLGRVAQLGGFGQLPDWMGPALELVVEASRVAVFLFVLGLSNVRKGVGMFLRVFRLDSAARSAWKRSMQRLRNHALTIVLNLAGFLVIAAIINVLIDQLAYETCLLLSLKSNGLLAMDSSEWTVLLFFKNILVIPFTLVFETFLVLWIIGSRFRNQTPESELSA